MMEKNEEDSVVTREEEQADLVDPVGEKVDLLGEEQKLKLVSPDDVLQPSLQVRDENYPDWKTHILMFFSLIKFFI